MIHVLCLNPTIDRMYYIDHFHKGAQFHGNHPDIIPGGKGVNVARILSELGDVCEFYAFVGGGNGNLIKQEIDNLHIVSHYFPHEGETRCTINIIDHAAGEETELTEDGEKVSLVRQKEFLDKLESRLSPNDLVVCSGLPMYGMDWNIYQQVAIIATNHHARCVVDANRQYLKGSFPAPFVLAKPNKEELASLFDVEGALTEQDVVGLARKLREKGAEHVLVSLGGNGAIFVSAQGAFWVHVPKVPVVSTIGSGDSSVAGFCHAMIGGSSPIEAIKFSMACGVANTLTAKVGHLHKTDLEWILPRISVEAL